MLLLLDHNAPRMMLSSIHDAREPVLDLQRQRPALAGLAHGDDNVTTAMVDQGHGGDEVLLGCTFR